MVDVLPWILGVVLVGVGLVLAVVVAGGTATVFVVDVVELSLELPQPAVTLAASASSEIAAAMRGSLVRAKLRESAERSVLAGGNGARLLNPQAGGEHPPGTQQQRSSGGSATRMPTAVPAISAVPGTGE